MHLVELEDLGRRVLTEIVQQLLAAGAVRAVALAKDCDR